MKHVHHVPESCLWHCIEGISEVDVDSIDWLSLSLDTGNASYMFLIQLFESWNMSLKSSQSEHRNLGFQKSDKIGTKWFLKKAIWQVKWRCLEDFPGMFHKKLRIFFCMRLENTFARPIWYKSCCFSNRIFFQKYTGCQVVAVKSMFFRPKVERKYLFPEISVSRFQLSRVLPQTLLIEPMVWSALIGPLIGEVFLKIGSSEFSVTSYTILFYSWKRTKL